MSLRSKCDRAIAAYAAGQGVAAHVYTAIGEDFAALNSSDPRKITDGPTVTVMSGGGRPDVRMTGDFRFQVAINIIGEAATQPDDTNASSKRVALDAVTQATSDIFMLAYQSDPTSLQATADAITLAGRALAVTDGTPDGDKRAANNSDMAEFTMLAWYDGSIGGGHPNSFGQANATSFAEQLNFEAVCCGRLIPDVPAA